MLRLGFSLVLAGCSSAEIRGGESMAAGGALPARVLASYRAQGCVDAAGGALTHPVRVVLAEGDAKRRVLIASRPSYDSVLIRNPASDGREHVFQVVLKAESGSAVLHDYRVPVDGGEGRMAVATEFVEGAPAPGQVVAKLSRVSFACRLAPERGAE